MKKWRRRRARAGVFPLRRWRLLVMSPLTLLPDFKATTSAQEGDEVLHVLDREGVMATPRANVAFAVATGAFDSPVCGVARTEFNFSFVPREKLVLVPRYNFGQRFADARCFTELARLIWQSLKLGLADFPPSLAATAIDFPLQGVSKEQAILPVEAVPVIGDASVCIALLGLAPPRCSSRREVSTTTRYWGNVRLLC